MKVSDLALFSSLSDSIIAASDNIQLAQQQLATGKRVAQPSDDPAAFAQAGLLQATRSAIANDGTLASLMQSRLNVADGALAQTTTAITTAMASATQGADGTISAAQMATIAKTVQGQLDQVIQSANIDYAGVHLFGGNQTQAAPFSPTGTYAGDTGTNSATFSNGSSFPVTFNGQSIFGDSTSGAIAALTSLITALATGNKANVTTALSQLTAALQQVTDARASIGTSINNASALAAGANATLTSLDDNINQVAGADIAKTAMVVKEATLQQEALVSFASEMERIPLVNIIA